MHREAVFYKVNHLNGVIDSFVSKLNTNIEPIKRKIAGLDFFSMVYLFVGFLIAGLAAVIVNQFYSIGTSLLIIAVYLISLVFVLWRNSSQVGYLQQALVLNMAVIIYIEN